MNKADVEILMEAIRDLSEAAERHGGYSMQPRAQFSEMQAKEARADMNDAWCAIERITGGKRP